ncbi:hypothetical protein [Dysgonomonas sp. GY617]|uniref:hypothetical protein n=1 Tax=Dysgonomonas sp. GY617 TaxID=2780420 RepID=UPI001883A8C8|nr:hypothetical protein [Dysgonomonas sp. GY617]
MASYKDLQMLVNEEIGNAKLQAFLSRFDNVLVGTNEIANMHCVNPRTIMNYINDGLIVPEVKLGEKDHHVFRLSYALALDFKDLQKQLRAKNRGY